MRILSILLLLCVVSNAADPKVVTDSVKEDGMSEQDMRKWYSIYKGAYIYVKEYDAVGCKDFGDVFDKLRVVRDKNLPTKGNVNFVKATSLKEFEAMDFTEDNKNKLSSELNNISEGLKEAIKNAR
jgi:hypothetical protein